LFLRPADPTKGNGTILFVVTNRGRKFLLPWIQDAVPVAAGAINDPKTAAHAGDGYAFRAGYTIVWNGWDPDAPKANGGMTIRIPVATDGGKPIVETIRDEFVFGTRLPATRPAAPLSYPAASTDQAAARLTVRARETDPPREIPASGWAYDGGQAIKLLPEGTKFQPGYIYDFHYPAKDPKPLGIGFAATRDLVAYLRADAPDAAGHPNPAGGKVSHVLALGISQSGRYLRDFIGQGFNKDESGTKVFDGVLAHISGIGRVFLNQPFGEPSRTSTQHEDHFFPENAFPFAHAAVKDPVTGKAGALLRGDGFDPLIIETNTSTEYWQKGASLLHTETLGGADLKIPDNVRLYMIAGTEHGGRAHLEAKPGSCVNPQNPHSPAPALRALLATLQAWVADGTKPPESRVPTLAAGALVPADRTGFPDLGGIAIAHTTNRVAPLADWVDPKPAQLAWVSLVSKVDADGNEVAGLRLPDIAVPIATYTGWNLYKAPYPEGELCDRNGSYIAFAKTKAEREAKGDPRPSLEERYGTHDAYVEKVRASAEDLVKARLLLAEDARAYVDWAQQSDPLR
jgi:hypothetical protein